MCRRCILLGIVAIISGCKAAPQPQQIATSDSRERKLVLLTREGCALTAAMRGNLDEALRSLGPQFSYELLDLDTLPETDARRGYPTPTLLDQNRDVFDMPEPTPPFPEPT